MLKFGDGTSIKYEGKGGVHVDCTNGKLMIFENILYKPKLKTNILILGKLDDQGYDMRIRKGCIILHDSKRRLLTKTHKTKGNMYLMKLNITKQCSC